MSVSWDAWRKDIVRGVGLFCGVLVVGLFVRSLVVRVRDGVVETLPGALRELRSDFAPEIAGPRDTAATWTYHAKVAPKQWVWIRNTNGSVTVQPARGDSLEVTAVKTYRQSDPAKVRLVAVPYDGGVAVCAVWQQHESHCGPGDEFRRGSTRGSDVAVAFTVRVPRRVGVGATTVNGGVRVTGASGPIHVATVSGDVEAETAEGPVHAGSVNGSVRAVMRALGDSGAVTLGTVNGSVTAELPARLNATVEASTINGSINTEYPLTVTGKFTSRKLEGTVGRGGSRVHITTVNGSINLKKASAAP